MGKLQCRAGNWNTWDFQLHGRPSPENQPSVAIMYVRGCCTAQFWVHGISNYMGLLNTRLGAWVNFSVGQAPGIHGSFNNMIAHP